MVLGFDSAWSDSMGSYFETMDTVSNAGIDFISFDCAFPGVNYYAKFLFYMILPFIVVFAAILVHACIYFINRDKEEVFITLKASCLMMLFLIYMKVSTKTFEVMNCIDIEGKSYLLADLYVRILAVFLLANLNVQRRIECNTSEHDTYVTIAGIMCVIFVLGLPLFTIVLLFFRKKEILHGIDVREYRFLYEGYNAKTIWWYVMSLSSSSLMINREVVFNAKKLVIVLFAVFLRRDSVVQVYAGLLLLIIGTDFFFFLLAANDIL